MSDYIVDSLAVSLGVEDFCNPCELIWALNNWFPDAPSERREEIARKGLRRAIEAGYLQVHESTEWKPSNELVPRQRALELLESERFWAHPAAWDGPPYFWFSATAGGEEALESGVLASL